MLKQIISPLIFLIFAGFVVSSDDAKTIISGIAIFLIGMHYMENGFKLFSGGTLESFLEKFTNTTPKAIGVGFLSTAVVQSSSLISVIIISFLSAELIGLTQAVGVIFGSNICTTTTAWLVSSFGLKIKIAQYAMPMLIFGVIFQFSKHNSYKRLGGVLIGLGFIFLGIAYMKEGFDTLKEGINLAVAHFIFNIITGLVAVLLIYQLRDLVELLAPYLSIAQNVLCHEAGSVSYYF